MIERLIIMQTEDNMLSLEREDKTTIIYPLSLLPNTFPYKEGDIVKSIVHNEDFIEFLELDSEAMERKRSQRKGKSQRLRERARRATNS